MAKKTKQEIKDADIATLKSQLKSAHDNYNGLIDSRTKIEAGQVAEMEILEVRLEAMEKLKV